MLKWLSKWCLFIFLLLGGGFTYSLDNSDREAVRSYMSSLSLQDKIRQLFLLNLEGSEQFKAVEWDKDKLPILAGGYILFSYNIAETSEGVSRFIKSVKDYAKKRGIITPYIAVDQEGGYVARLRGITPPLRSPKRVSRELTIDGAAALYREQARAMSTLGIDLNLAPVVEVLNEGNKDFLDTRSYGTRDKAIVYSKVCVSAYEAEGVGTTLKHFPGNCNVDPHIGLPKIVMTQDELKEDVLAVFGAAIGEGAEAVLMSHAIVDVEGINSDGTPSCLSKYWVDQLRALGFKGLIISDDIFMAALEKNGYPPRKAIIMALDAGVNVLMLSEKTFSRYATIVQECATSDSALLSKIDDSVERVLLFKLSHGLITLGGSGE